MNNLFGNFFDVYVLCCPSGGTLKMQYHIIVWLGQEKKYNRNQKTKFLGIFRIFLVVIFHFWM